MKTTGSIPPRQSTYAAKRRIERVIQKIEGNAVELRSIQDELEVPEFEELQEICAGRRPWSYEALLLGLLCLMDFHLAEVTVTCWREGYAKYPPSRLNGGIYDPSLARAVRNWIDRKRESLRAEARTQPSCSGSPTPSTN